MVKAKLISVLLAPLLLSCGLATRSFPNVLVIAVDHLGFNEVNCSRDSHSSPGSTDSADHYSHSGLAILCQESLRLTHAYTTSPLSAPALTSVLTAKNPIDHGLRQNGSSSLSSTVETIAEVAQSKGVATSFFSGGPPLFRSLNIQQGFETFDDNLSPSVNGLYRSFEKSLKLFEAWRKENSRQSFLTFFYVPDLLFTNTPTQTNLGESRNLTFESQLEAFDESLFDLIQTLKKAKIWDSTTVILLGLNGPEREERTDELSNLNLFSDRTQIGLLIKPAQKPRDSGLSWSFDNNVSLIDVGETLFAIYGSASTPTHTAFPALSLASIFSSSQNESAKDVKISQWNQRPLLIESSWGAWQNQGPVRYALRLDQLLFVLDEKIKIYNSLIDKLETTPIRTSETYLREPLAKVLSLIENQHLQMAHPLSHEIYLKWNGLSEIWSLESQGLDRKLAFERLAHRLKDDSEVTHLFTMELLNQQNWRELERWAQGMKLTDMALIAKRNLKKTPNHKTFSNGCLAALDLGKNQISDLRRCHDALALSFLDWIFLDRHEPEDSPSKDILKKKFLRLYLQMRNDRKIAELNWAFQGLWNVSTSLRQDIPMIELMLSLPETQKYRLEIPSHLTK